MLLIRSNSNELLIDKSVLIVLDMIYNKVCQSFDGGTKTSATISLNQQAIN